ncbi:PhnA domain-containing protein [Salinimonas marina]|uniref:PhnA domain-containing protein n=1 Tax=Salinimonas marina TaxID=2785918 RepID=A0A7S9HDA0_9ALTE|nr:alkylphosphonate utilization protein [Salinimonas marina]QPG05914.1 PhnA domain-containing protein [Salinimonas marina]
MSEQQIRERAQQRCELCKSEASLGLYAVPHSPVQGFDSTILVCETCATQLTGEAAPDANHWRCLNDAIWSPVPAVQVVAWRMLKTLNAESWAQDLLEMMYLDDEMQQWAQASEATTNSEPTLDSNGMALSAGDTVHLIKDLNVKGVSFTAKRGTAVRNISLSDNTAHIEGRVNGTRIVIIAAYTKKA